MNVMQIIISLITTFQADLKCYWQDPTLSLSQRTTEEHTNATGTRKKGNRGQFDIGFPQ